MLNWFRARSQTVHHQIRSTALAAATSHVMPQQDLCALLPLRLFGQAFVVAIILALLSSLILLPAFYTPFLKHDAGKFALTHKEAE
jgi:hypothetical protein